MDNDRQQQARKYARIHRIIFILDFGLNGLWALFWVISGFSISLRTFINALGYPVLIVNGLFIIVYGLTSILVLFPLSLYSDFLLPIKFNMSNENFSSWIVDQIKGTLLSGVVGVPFLLIIYWFLSIQPQTWWIWSAVLIFLASVVFAKLYPILIAPIFNKFTPLSQDHAHLIHRLTVLAESSHTQISGVFQYDMSRRSKSANAALMGLGDSKRIVLSDTLLENFTEDEIETVLAHELAHHVHKDIPVSIAINSILIFASFYIASIGLNWGISFFKFSSISDIANLPYLEIIFGIFSLFIFPIQNLFSRHLEKRADLFSLQLTQKPAAFASALTKLSDQNLAEMDPDPIFEFLMYSHPALGKRILMAENFVVPVYE
jgi:STE24 endopeptidase